MVVTYLSHAISTPQMAIKMPPFHFITTHQECAHPEEARELLCTGRPSSTGFILAYFNTKNYSHLINGTPFLYRSDAYRHYLNTSSPNTVLPCICCHEVATPAIASNIYLAPCRLAGHLYGPLYWLIYRDRCHYKAIKIIIASHFMGHECDEENSKLRS